ncbi:hypothetical protein B0H14DRAFT_861269 [Mycena olivaceomarginata]|nr:hypothetical protein B0H14DRAFT_861269 [Mycena olivaceomarginata]
MAQFRLTCGAPTNLPLLDVPPEVSALLTNNDVPLESQIPLIRDIISDGQTEFDELEAILAQLIPRRNEVAERVRQHRAVLSAVRRVPPELIGDIFALTLSDNDDASATANKPPWYLGHICRSWRHAALSYPRLWSYIAVPSFLASKDSPLLSGIQAQLFRSASGPLDIRWPFVQDEVNSDLLELVLPHSNRWRSLTFDPGAYSSVINCLGPVNGRLDQLEQLKAVHCSAMTIPDIFSITPNLRRIILTDEFFSNSPRIAIQWGQITHYKGTYTRERQRDILRTAPNLLECVLGFSGTDVDQPSHISMVTVPHLRRLCLMEPNFLSSLAMPLLEDLCVFNARVLPPFLHRFSCTLKRLSLLCCTIDSAVISVLRELPNLTYLRLEYAMGNEVDWINPMLISGAPSDICPNLTTFVFGYASATPIHWNSFFDMARSRFQRLGRLYFYHSLIFPPEDLLDELKMMEDEGFDVVTLSPFSPQLMKDICLF